MNIEFLFAKKSSHYSSVDQNVFKCMRFQAQSWDLWWLTPVWKNTCCLVIGVQTVHPWLLFLRNSAYLQFLMNNHTQKTPTHSQIFINIQAWRLLTLTVYIWLVSRPVFFSNTYRFQPLAICCVGIHVIPYMFVHKNVSLIIPKQVLVVFQLVSDLSVYEKLKKVKRISL